MKQTGARLELADFDHFYAVYPRHIARLDAERAWRQVTRRYDPEAIIRGAEKFARLMADEGTEKQFIPYPASWLRAGRWMDEEPATIKPQPLFRPARNVDELRQYLQSIGKPVSAEIAKARDVTELPAFARMVPADWHPNVTQIRKAG